MPFWGHEAVPKVDVDTAVKAIDEGALLIDIGTPAEWIEGHLPSALLVEVESFDLDLYPIAKDRPILVAARNKDLEEEVVGAMRERGYDAAAIDGGIAAWRASGRELVRAE